MTTSTTTNNNSNSGQNVNIANNTQLQQVNTNIIDNNMRRLIVQSYINQVIIGRKNIQKAPAPKVILQLILDFYGQIAGYMAFGKHMGIGKVRLSGHIKGQGEFKSTQEI